MKKLKSRKQKNDNGFGRCYFPKNVEILKKIKNLLPSKSEEVVGKVVKVVKKKIRANKWSMEESEEEVIEREAESMKSSEKSN